MNVALPTPDSITEQGANQRLSGGIKVCPRGLGLCRGLPVTQGGGGGISASRGLPPSCHSLHGVCLTVQRYPFSWTNIGGNFADKPIQNLFCTCVYILGKHSSFFYTVHGLLYRTALIYFRINIANRTNSSL